MPAVQLNIDQFNSRLKHLLDAWNSAGKNDDYESISGADGLLLTAGDPAGQDEPIKKSVALQTWLLGFEFPSTIFLFRKDQITILTSASKAKILAQLQTANPIIPIQILAQAKAKEPPTNALPTLAGIYTTLQRVGVITKDNTSGKLIDDWNNAISEAESKPETVDMSPAVSAILAVKDEEELKCTRIAANLTSTLMNHHVAPKLETILDRESKITHETFAAQIESRLGSGEGENAKGPDMKVWGKGRGLNEVDWDSTEFCYAPVIQSKGTASGYDLRSNAESSSDMMGHKGVLLVAVGMRYKGYCANIGRTFVVDPSKEQETVYALLVTLQSELLHKMKDGVPARDIYMHAIAYIREKRPELEKHFVKNVGFSMGMEFRDSQYLLSPKCNRNLKSNMIFNLALGFTDLEDGDRQKYSMLLTDTVKVDHEKGICLTDCIKTSKDVLFFLNTQSDDEEKENAKSTKKPPAKPINGNGSPVKHKVAGGKVLRNKTRSAAQEDVIQTTAARIAEHQRELHIQRQEEGLAKFSEEGQGGASKEGKGWKRFQSYKGEAGLPKEVETMRIYVDRKAQSVVLPINGFAVPLHINAIKNASKNDEGEYTYLRINFQSPGQLAGKKEDTPFEDPDATFIRSITYRSADGSRFDHVFRQITELKKEVNKREQQKKEMADVIEQDVLVELKSRRPLKLPEVFVRPAADGKRLPGEVEIHQNGLRYQSTGSHNKIDILFSNIKHLFFQPCDHELLVIIHVHLKAPIMVGKKKAKDIQFYREASDVQFDETGNRKRKYRYGDEDEIELEQQERKRRQALNKEFKHFAEKIAEASTSSTGDPLESDVPFRDLAFEGVPFRTNVKLQPTTECLVHLTDTPFLVVTLGEIEIASLERVQFGLKQFDMVLVFRDFTRAPLQINSIPTSQLDDVKNWLDSVDIPLSESPVNLNWGPIMKTINESPYDFFQQGGWSFLGTGTGGDDDEESVSDTESEYAADTDELIESESDHESGSEFSDSDASGDSGGASSFDEDDSSGDDWDELERKAEKSDNKKAAVNGKRRDDSDESDFDKPKKKSSAKANGVGKKSKR